MRLPLQEHQQRFRETSADLHMAAGHRIKGMPNSCVYFANSRRAHPCYYACQSRCEAASSSAVSEGNPICQVSIGNSPALLAYIRAISTGPSTFLDTESTNS